jgi:DNA-binding response OmpR family regulator
LLNPVFHYFCYFPSNIPTYLPGLPLHQVAIFCAEIKKYPKSADTILNVAIWKGIKMKKLDASILVVDDEEMNRDILIRQLEKEGYTVTAVPGGQEAMELMAVEQFDLVLLDIMMPGVTGYDVLQHVQLDKKLKDNTPVMMISAIGDRDTVVKCIQMGAEDYLVKPFNMPVVKSRIWRSIFNRRNIADNGDLSQSSSDVHILLVDDQELNLDVISRRLETLKYKVSCVESGEEALAMLNDVAVDLVLLDIMMPGMDGYQVLDAIRANQLTQNIPVIMISALDDIESVKKSIEKGADDYLMKPINTVLLKTRITSCLSSKDNATQNNVVI